MYGVCRLVLQLLQLLHYQRDTFHADKTLDKILDTNCDKILVIIEKILIIILDKIFHETFQKIFDRIMKETARNYITDFDLDPEKVLHDADYSETHEGQDRAFLPNVQQCRLPSFSIITRSRPPPPLHEQASHGYQRPKHQHHLSPMDPYGSWKESNLVSRLTVVNVWHLACSVLNTPTTPAAM